MTNVTKHAHPIKQTLAKVWTQRSQYPPPAINIDTVSCLTSGFGLDFTYRARLRRICNSFLECLSEQKCPLQSFPTIHQNHERRSLPLHRRFLTKPEKSVKIQVKQLFLKHLLTNNGSVILAKNEPTIPITIASQIVTTAHPAIA